MLSVDPHFDSTLLKSNFFDSIFTCEGRDGMNKINYGDVTGRKKEGQTIKWMPILRI